MGAGFANWELFLNYKSFNSKWNPVLFYSIHIVIFEKINRIINFINYLILFIKFYIFSYKFKFFNLIYLDYVPK